jgi:ASC-1-like (ASCH) protein
MDLTNKKVLRLTLKKEPFDVMVTGEKKEEYRTLSKWINSRLLDKDRRKKHYDYIEFTNGYGKDKPRFICEYNSFYYHHFQESTKKIFYSNGFELLLESSYVVILLGEIIYKENLK